MADTALLTPYIPLALSAGAVITWWVAAFPRLSIWLLAGSVIVGQLIRLPLPGQGGGLLLSDIAVVLVLLAAGIQLLQARKRQQGTSNFSTLFTFLFAPFIIWSLFTLAIRFPELATNQFIIAASYWARLTAHLLLVPSLMYLATNQSLKKTIHHGLVFASASIAIIGFLQLVFLTNLVNLQAYPALSFITSGWDPHMGRLVSTWLDPNFVGAFLVITSFYLLAKKKWLLLAMTVVAFILTQSRSSYGAALLTSLISLPFVIHFWVARAVPQFRYHRSVIIGATIAIAITLAASATALLGERATGFITPDATVNLRLSSLSAAWSELAIPNMWLGVGYNAYQYAAADADLISSFSIHSRAGSDNSLLTLLITTGIPGVVLFLLPWAAIIHHSWKQVLASGTLYLTPIAAILFLFSHSQGVNSFLYSHLLITISMIVTLFQQPAEQKTEISVQ